MMQQPSPMGFSQSYPPMMGGGYGMPS